MSADKEAENLGSGCILGVIICMSILALLWLIMPPSQEVISKTRIELEWQLQTDGKKVDTLFIYKSN